MKRAIFFSFFLLIYNIGVQAQMLQLGVKAGVNASNIISNIDNTQIRIGFRGGAMARLNIIPKIAIQPEILYSLQGAGFDTDTEDLSYRWNLNYLQLPILAKIYLTDNFNVQIGPSFNFLLDAKSGGSFDSGFDFLDQLFQDFAIGDINDSFSNAEVAVLLGVGYEINNFTIDLRYNLSLTNINDLEFDDEKWRNQVLNISLGYYFLEL